VVVCSEHGEAGPVRYLDSDDCGFSLFAGHPVRRAGVTGTGVRSVLDAAALRRGGAAWADHLDGRFVVARYTLHDRDLDIVTDPLGGHPLYRRRLGVVKWFSNSVEALRTLGDGSEVDPVAMATFAGCGWSLGGRPLWQAVERVPRSARITVTPAGESTRQTLTDEDIGRHFRAAADPRGAARDLVAMVTALADWPGRPLHLELTGGRDSRLVLAAALAGRLAFAVHTGAIPHLPGFPETADVRTARRVARIERLDHHIDVPGSAQSPLPAFRALAAHTGGLYSLSTIFPGALPFWRRDAPLRGPLPVVLAGVGGEIARGYYGRGGRHDPRLARRLEARLIGRYPRPILTEAGRALVREYIWNWVQDRLESGLAPAVIPDMLYVAERMPNWAGPLHTATEAMRDVTAPLWTATMLPHLLAHRAGGNFHRALLRELRPSLLSVPFVGATYDRGVGAALLAFAHRGRAEIERRLHGLPEQARDADPLPGAVKSVAELALGDHDHPAWDVVDRKRALRLLRRDPARLDPRSREQVWRMAALLTIERKPRVPAPAGLASDSSRS
jgi:hypothetical protein